MGRGWLNQAGTRCPSRRVDFLLLHPKAFQVWPWSKPLTPWCFPRKGTHSSYVRFIDCPARVLRALQTFTSDIHKDLWRRCSLPINITERRRWTANRQQPVRNGAKIKTGAVQGKLHAHSTWTQHTRTFTAVLVITAWSVNNPMATTKWRDTHSPDNFIMRNSKVGKTNLQWHQVDLPLPESSGLQRGHETRFGEDENVSWLFNWGGSYVG